MRWLPVRVRLCKLVADRSDWLHVGSYGAMSSYWATRRLRRQIKRDCVASIMGRQVRRVEVMGPDAFLRFFGHMANEAAHFSSKLTLYKERVVCCVICPGNDNASEKDKLGRLLSFAHDLRADVVVVDPEDAGLAVLGVTSSSVIRQLIRKKGWDCLQDGFTHNCCQHFEMKQKVEDDLLQLSSGHQQRNGQHRYKAGLLKLDQEPVWMLIGALRKRARPCPASLQTPS